MKKICLILTLILTLTSAIPVVASAAEVKNSGYIVLQDASDAKLIAAGKTLSDYMKKVTDKDFPVADEGEGLRFTLGFSSDAPVNGYIIKTGENDVSITGNGTSGPEYEEQKQMGGDFCCQWCCEMAICNMMLNCCCNSCG